MSDRHDELTPEERHALEMWPVLTPPEGLVEVVLDRALAARRRRRVAWAAAAAVVLCAGGAGLWHAASRVDHGAHLAAERVTLELGPRAVAVAESGSRMAWRIPARGPARVEQLAGNVFYRINHGDDLTITTPLGAVGVLGTCLRVEVIPMKGVTAGAVAGTALTAAVLVSVYEGRVTVRNAGSPRALEVGAGEAARLSMDGGPARVIRSRHVAALANARAAVVAASKQEQPAGFVEVPEATYLALLDASEAMQERVEELEQRLGVAEEMRREREGVALEPPPNLHERYKKEAVLAAYETAIQQGDLPVQVTAVDCTEYPCIVFGEAVGERGRQWSEQPRFADQLFDQPAFGDYADKGETDRRLSVWRRINDDADGGSTTSTSFGAAFYPKADHDERGPELDRRLDYRVNEVLDPPGDEEP
jgi:hypothetical protein